MKKIIYISGIVSIILILLGSLFKMMHWPGAGPMLVVGLGSFCFWFLPAALMNNYRKADMKQWKWVYIVTFITFFIDTLGALFKIMHWPGAGWFLIIGIPLPFILFLPFFIYHSSREKNFPMINFMGVMFGLTFLGVFTALLALNVSKSVLDHGLVVANDNIDAYEYYQNPGESNTEVSKQAEKIYDFIDSLNTRLLITPENISNYNNNEDYAILTLNRMPGQDEIRKMLFGSEGESGSAYELKEMLIAYKELLLELQLKDEALIKLIKGLLDTETLDYDGYKSRWEDREELWSSYLHLVLATMTRIKENVKLLEHEISAELLMKNLAMNNNETEPK